MDSGTDWTLTETSGVTVIPGSAASSGSTAVGIRASTPSMMWYCVTMVPPTSSTAATGLSSPSAVTMTASLGLADAAGTPVSSGPANAAATTAPAAAIRPFFQQAGRARYPAPAPAPDELTCRIWQPLP